MLACPICGKACRSKVQDFVIPYLRGDNLHKLIAEKIEHSPTVDVAMMTATSQEQIDGLVAEADLTAAGRRHWTIVEQKSGSSTTGNGKSN